MQRLYVGRTSKVYAQFPSVPDGAVTVDLVRHDGTVLVNGAAATAEGGNRFSFTVPRSLLTDVGLLTATFEDVATFSLAELAEIVGRPYFEVASVYNPVVVPDQYPTADVELMRAAVEAQIDDNLGTSYVERFQAEFGLEIHPTRGTARLMAPYVRRVLTVKEDGVTVDPASYTLRGRYLERPGRWLGGRVDAEYVVGVGAACPADLQMAAVEATRQRLIQDKRTGTGPRTTMLTTQVGTMQIAIAGLKRPFGIPEVDAIVMKHAEDLAEVIS